MFKYFILVICSLVNLNLWGQFLEDSDIEEELEFHSDGVLVLRGEDMDVNDDGVITPQEVLDCSPRGRFVIFLPENSRRKYKYYVESSHGVKALRKVVRGIEEGFAYKYKRHRLRREGKLERRLAFFNLLQIYGDKILKDPDIGKAEKFWVDAIRPGTHIHLPTENELMQPLLLSAYPKGGFLNNYRDVKSRLNEQRLMYTFDPECRHVKIRVKFPLLRWSDYVLDAGTKYSGTPAKISDFFTKLELVYSFGDILMSYREFSTSRVTSAGSSIFLPCHSVGTGVILSGVWNYHEVNEGISDYNSWLVEFGLFFWEPKRFLPPLLSFKAGWQGNTSNDNRFLFTTRIDNSFYAISLGAEFEQEMIETALEDEKKLRIKTLPLCKVKLSTPLYRGFGLIMEGEVKASVPYYAVSIGIYWK